MNKEENVFLAWVKDNLTQRIQKENIWHYALLFLQRHLHIKRGGLFREIGQ